MRRVLFILGIVSLFFCACGRVGGSNSSDEKPIEAGFFHSCTRTSGPTGEPQVDTMPPPIDPTSMRIHIFVENSGSMNGFINNTSDFQVALGKQVALLCHYYGYDNIRLYYINQDVYPQLVNAADCNQLIGSTNNMCKKNTFGSIGETGSTNLNDIFKMALDSVSETSLSIVISDCIYSISGTGTSHSLLGNASNETMNNFLQKSRKMSSLSTSLIQLYSDFDGGYWDYKHPNGSASAVLNCKRPYYLCVLGTHKSVDAYLKNIDVREMKGYSNQYTISNLDVSKTKASIMNHYGKKGNFRLDVTDGKECHSISKVKARNKVLGFAIGVDLSSYTMSETDKLDTNNYQLGGNYRVIAIKKIDKAELTDPTDCKIVDQNTLTHFIEIESTGFPNDLTISIRRSVPEWVKDFSSSDDTKIQTDANEQKKTFGLSYLVDGIAEAYLTLAKDKNNFTKLNFKFKK